MIKNLRGEEKKIELVNNYELMPVAHIKLLEGQEKQGCCGKIKNRYYVFDAKNKFSEQTESFIVGYDCAEQLLQLIDHSKLQLFNPIKNLTSNETQNISEKIKSTKIKMCELNQELYNAIHIVCAAWNGPPKQHLSKTLAYIRKCPRRPTNSFAVINFNKYVLARDAKGRTLLQMIEDLKLIEPNLKQYTFPEMEKVLSQANEISYIQ